MSCVGCNRLLSDCLAQPTYSEKPISNQVLYYSTCSHFLCSTCCTSKRSLASYCLLCDTTHLLGRKVVVAKSILKEPELPKYQLAQTEEGSNDRFVIGEEEEEMLALPAYDRIEIDSVSAVQPTATSSTDQVGTDGKNTIHYLRPQETLVGIALRYRVDARLLCTMNNLPYSTTSTTPHLLHTKPFLLLPAEIKVSLSADPLLSKYEEHKRLTLHRFQVKAKISSHAESKVYLDHIFALRKKEFEATGSVGEIRMGGELEEALENYTVDKNWENDHGNGKGKGKLMRRGDSSKNWSFM